MMRAQAREARGESITDLFRRSSAELNFFFVERNAVEHRLDAFARPRPALMRFHDCSHNIAVGMTAQA